MNNLKIGDIVYLKSGSVQMTVIAIDGPNCHVTWHDKDSKEHTAYYPQEALTKESPNFLPPEAFQKS